MVTTKKWIQPVGLMGGGSQRGTSVDDVRQRRMEISMYQQDQTL